MISFIALVSCSDDSDPLTPPDYSNLIKGQWSGIGTTPRSDTLLFDMVLDATDNVVSGTSKFNVNGEDRDDLTVSGTVGQPDVFLEFKSASSDFTFTGKFSVTNGNIMEGTLQDEQFSDVKVVFTRK
jgi:hypothetical protein